MDFKDIILLLSGIALFLFGMTLMGDGLKKVSGNKLEPILFRLSGTPAKGILLGTAVTAVIQSSSATSVMAVGFVNSNMMKVRQAIYVIIGAILGTSITGWVICLSYIDSTSGIGNILSSSTLTGLVAVIGIIFRMFSKKPQRKYIGDIMMGFAVLMFGMSTMSGSVEGLGHQEWFTGLLTTVSNPILGILIGTVFCAVLQSASAAVGIIQALSLTGAITFNATLPLLMGISIGGSLPVLMSSLGANTKGKRTAFSYLAVTLIGVLLCAAIFYILDAIIHFSFTANIQDPVSVALMNTLMRLVMILLMAPLTGFIEALVTMIIPDKGKTETPIVNLEDRFLSHPALALEQTRTAINNMAKQAQEAIQIAFSLLLDYNGKNVQKVDELEDIGDRYEDALGSYLMKLSSSELNEQQARHTSVFLHTLSDLERLSDHAENIAEGATEMHDKQLSFTPQAIEEFKIMNAAISEILSNTLEAFINEDYSLAAKIEPLEEVIDDLCAELKMRHVKRLQKGLCTVTGGFVFNDLLINFERISDHCSNIAVAIIELRDGAFATHEYLEQVKDKRTPDFEQTYDMYREKFSLRSIPADDTIS